MVNGSGNAARWWALKNLGILIFVVLPFWLVLRLLILGALTEDFAPDGWLSGIALLWLSLAPWMLLYGSIQVATLWFLRRSLPSVNGRILSFLSVLIIPLGLLVRNRGELGVLGSADFAVALGLALLLYGLIEYLPAAQRPPG